MVLEDTTSSLEHETAICYQKTFTEGYGKGRRCTETGQSFNVTGSYQLRVEGPTVAFPPNAIGSSIGVNLDGVICYKPETEEVAFIVPPFPNNSWDCKAAGLPIKAGDTVW
jgi:hypothetical protein